MKAMMWRSGRGEANATITEFDAEALVRVGGGPIIAGTSGMAREGIAERGINLRGWGRCARRLGTVGYGV